MSTKQQLTDDQERMRLEGLRRLARLIARHALAHPERYGNGPTAERHLPAQNDREIPDREPRRKDGAA